MAKRYVCDFCESDIVGSRQRVDMRWISEQPIPEGRKTPPYIGRDLCPRCSAIVRRFLNGKARVIHIDAFKRAIEDVKAMSGPGVYIDDVVQILNNALERFSLEPEPLLKVEDAG